MGAGLVEAVIPLTPAGTIPFDKGGKNYILARMNNSIMWAG